MAFTAAQLKVISNDVYSGLSEQSSLPYIANTRWSGAAEGATEVTILNVGDVTFNPVVNGTPAVPQSPAPTAPVLKMDIAEDFWLPVYDTERLVPGFIQATGAKAAAVAATRPDAKVLTLATKAGFASGNWIAGSADAAINVNGANILDQLDKMYEVMRSNNVPDGEIFVALPQKLMTKVKIGLRKQGMPVQESANALFSGLVTKACGLNIIQTNQYVEVTGSGTFDYRILYGSAAAIAAAYLPVKTQQQPIALGWGVNLGGIIQYGCKVVDTKIGGAAYLNVVAES